MIYFTYFILFLCLLLKTCIEQLSKKTLFKNFVSHYGRVVDSVEECYAS